MNSVIKKLAQPAPFRSDLDYHVVRASLSPAGRHEEREADVSRAETMAHVAAR
jgi:hypothetical protein